MTRPRMAARAHLSESSPTRKGHFISFGFIIGASIYKLRINFTNFSHTGFQLVGKVRKSPRKVKRKRMFPIQSTTTFLKTV